MVTNVYENGLVSLHDHRADIRGVCFQIIQPLVDFLRREWDRLGDDMRGIQPNHPNPKHLAHGPHRPQFPPHGKRRRHTIASPLP